MARKPADQSVNREEIILAAAEVLHRNGYEATTMKDIAAEVNLTAASLYHHFRNKDALLLAVLEAGITKVIGLLEPIVQSDLNNTEKLRELVRVHVTSIAEHTAVGAAMIFEIRPLMKVARAGSIQTANGAIDGDMLARGDAFFAQRDYFENLFRDVVQAGIDAGEFRPVDVAVITRTMLGSNNWVAVWYKEGGRLSGEQIADIIAEHFLLALKR